MQITPPTTNNAKLVQLCLCDTLNLTNLLAVSAIEQMTRIPLWFSLPTQLRDWNVIHHPTFFKLKYHTVRNMTKSRQILIRQLLYA